MCRLELRAERVSDLARTHGGEFAEQGIRSDLPTDVLHRRPGREQERELHGGHAWGRWPVGASTNVSSTGQDHLVQMLCDGTGPIFREPHAPKLGAKRLTPNVLRK